MTGFALNFLKNKVHLTRWLNICTTVIYLILY